MRTYYTYVSIYTCQRPSLNIYKKAMLSMPQPGREHLLALPGHLCPELVQSISLDRSLRQQKLVLMAELLKLLGLVAQLLNLLACSQEPGPDLRVLVLLALPLLGARLEALKNHAKTPGHGSQRPRGRWGMTPGSLGANLAPLCGVWGAFLVRLV